MGLHLCQWGEVVRLVQVQGLFRASLLAQQPVTIPLKQGLAKGVIPVLGGAGDGLASVRRFGDLGALQLVLYIPRQGYNGVLTNALFYRLNQAPLQQIIKFLFDYSICLDCGIAKCFIKNIIL